MTADGGMVLGLGALAIVAVFAVPVMCLAVIFGFILLLVRFLRGGKAANAAMTQEEARIFQEMHHGMERMAQRIEALETILLDKQQKEEVSR